MAFALSLLSCIALVGCQPPQSSIADTPPPPNTSTQKSQLEYLGQVKFPTHFEFENTQVGGLSGITYDSQKNLYYAISDDRALVNQARFYTLKINLNPLTVTPVSVTPLLDTTGEPFPAYSLDPEGIALTNAGTLFISSEGDVERSITPFIKEFSPSGQEIRSLPIPLKFLSQNGQGIRNNAAFESLTLTPDDRFLYTVTESALVQDGAEADTRNGSLNRIIQYDQNTGQPEAEFLYLTERVLTPPKSADGFSTNGVVELIALDRNTLLSLERGFAEDVGTTVLLYEISIVNATNIAEFESLRDRPGEIIVPVEKRLLLNLRTLNVAIDNIEGMTLGEELPDGRRSLILVSDNNFNPLQFTQFLAFAIAIP